MARNYGRNYSRRSYGKSNGYVTGYAKKSKPTSRVYIPKRKIMSIARHAVRSTVEQKTVNQFSDPMLTYTAPDEGYHLPLATLVANGTGDSDRIGDNIYIRKFFGRYTVIPTSVSDTLNYNTFRCMIWRMKEGRENVNVAGPLSDATPLQALYTTAITAQQLRNEIPDRSRFMILYDKTFTLKIPVGDATSTGQSDFEPVPKTHNFVIKKPFEYQWSDISFAADPTANVLRTHPVVFSIWSDVQGAVVPELTFSIFTNFIDA